MRELELDKQNNQAFDSLIDFSFYFKLTYFSYMTSAHDFYLSEIICLNILLEFLSFVYMTSKLNILSNHTKHPKRLAPCYTLSLFTILKSLYPIGQSACLEKMTLIRGQSRPIQRK